MITQLIMDASCDLEDSIEVCFNDRSAFEDKTYYILPKDSAQENEALMKILKSNDHQLNKENVSLISNIDYTKPNDSTDLDNILFKFDAKNDHSKQISMRGTMTDQTTNQDLNIEMDDQLENMMSSQSDERRNSTDSRKTKLSDEEQSSDDVTPKKLKTSNSSDPQSSSQQSLKDNQSTTNQLDSTGHERSQSNHQIITNQQQTSEQINEQIDKQPTEEAADDKHIDKQVDKEQNQTNENTDLNVSSLELDYFILNSDLSTNSVKNKSISQKDDSTTSKYFKSNYKNISKSQTTELKSTIDRRIINSHIKQPSIIQKIDSLSKTSLHKLQPQFKSVSVKVIPSTPKQELATTVASKSDSELHKSSISCAKQLNRSSSISQMSSVEKKDSHQQHSTSSYNPTWSRLENPELDDVLKYLDDDVKMKNVSGKVDNTRIYGRDGKSLKKSPKIIDPRQSPNEVKKSKSTSRKRSNDGSRSTGEKRPVPLINRTSSYFSITSSSTLRSPLNYRSNGNSTIKEKYDSKCQDAVEELLGFLAPDLKHKVAATFSSIVKEAVFESVNTSHRSGIRRIEDEFKPKNLENSDSSTNRRSSTESNLEMEKENKNN